VLKWRSKRDVDAGVAFSRNKKIRYDNGKDPPVEDMVGELVLAARADFQAELSELAKVSSFSFLLVSGSTPERSAFPPPLPSPSLPPLAIAMCSEPRPVV
jgi:hypothetical protein